MRHLDDEIILESENDFFLFFAGDKSEFEKGAFPKLGETGDRQHHGKREWGWQEWNSSISNIYAAPFKVSFV